MVPPPSIPPLFFSSDCDGTKRVDPFAEIKKYGRNNDPPREIINLIKSWQKVIKLGLNNDSKKNETISKKYEWIADRYEELMRGENVSILPFNGYPWLTKEIVKL
jgi:hypothetical protein